MGEKTTVPFGLVSPDIDDASQMLSRTKGFITSILIPLYVDLCDDGFVCEKH